MNPGESIAHYKVTEKIGARGMGEVFLATDTKLGRLTRFRSEARTLASLQHSNVASINGLIRGGISCAA